MITHHHLHHSEEKGRAPMSNRIRNLATFALMAAAAAASNGALHKFIHTAGAISGGGRSFL